MNFNFFVSPQKDEIIKTTIHVKNDKPAIVGNVLDFDEKPIKDAFLVVDEVDKNNYKPLKTKFFTYTDEWGSFALAPLEVDKLYNVKVYTNHEKIRILETILE